MRHAFFCFLIFITVQFLNLAFGAIPAAERAALIALYNATDGNNWKTVSGWKTPPLHTDGFALPGTEGNWYGVSVSGDHVTELDFYYNGLNGTIPPDLGNLSNLEVLELHCNYYLYGTIPSQLGNLSHLRTLRLNVNYLSGSIPPQLGNLGNLTLLSLGDNQLTGSIPSQLANLKNLQLLSFGNNQLSGSIPSQLGNMSNLVGLTLYQNRLSGGIPPELGNLSQLRYLTLDQNQLSGSIPSQLGNLSRLESFNLNENQLSGTIPSNLTNLSKITGLDLGYNCLSAADSALRAWLDAHDPDWEANQDRCGTVIFLPAVTTKTVSAIGLTSASCGGEVTSDGGDPVTTRGVCWSTSLSPTIYDSRSRDGSGTGSFTSTIVNLLPGITYHVRAYATNSKGTAYGADVRFTTASIPGIPKVTTTPVSDITKFSAVSGGNITTGGITARGVCWSKSLNPTIYDDKTSDGTGAGSFTSTITGLTPGTSYHVRAYATNSMGTAYGANYGFTTLLSPGSPTIALSHSSLNFGAVVGEQATGPQTVLINNIGSGTLVWKTTVYGNWVTVTPTSGVDDSSTTVSVNLQALPTSDYNGNILIYDYNASNSPQTITATLHIYSKGNTAPPFGEFATPVDGSTGYNSIPVTGWVLDDIEVASVKIYNGSSYIGDVVFVDGARPDVEAAYPTYPNNYKAGWGYMLLTHFLPNGGNGTYTLIAKATDKEGHVVTLGSKTITVDNAHAVKPFGALDTPTQGGTASGSAFIDWGWVLTPQPNKIPINGQTIAVYVDGVKLGYPKYNLYRADIASLFPGYANSSGAAGYFSLDTTTYTNGNHTISWVAVDDAGNTDGIGSRYFSIANVGSSSSLASSGFPGMAYSHALELESLPVNDTDPVYVAHGYARSGECLERQERELFPDINGTVAITLKELEPLEIRLGEYRENMAALHGYMVVDGSLRALPVGSTLDVKSGTFYWLPGPGFIGMYELAFVMEDSGGQRSCRKVQITIVPAR